MMFDITINSALTDAKGAAPAAVPEPSTFVLLGTGLIAAGILAGAARRRATSRILS
jgi:hypothetical protein